MLHALWDSMRGIALVLTMLLSATPQQLQLIEQGAAPQPDGAQLGLFLVIEFGGMAVVAAMGIGALLGVWLRWGIRTPARA